MSHVSLVCHEQLVTGMDWINGKWVNKKGRPREFLLTYDLDEKHLSKNSLARFFSGDIEWANYWSCETFDSEAFDGVSICTNLTHMVAFNYNTLSGSESNSFGNLYPEDKEDGKKDSMYVGAFTCSKTI